METVKINMVPKGAVKAAHASQGDAPRIVRFELFDEFLPYTLDGSEDITLTVVRPDTEEIVSTVTNTEEAYIDVSFTSEMTAIRGVANCEIKISKSGAEIGSHNFDLNIERDAYGEDITVETAQGVIATFTTGVIDNLVGLKTTFEPKQDLHGYETPWIDSNVVNKAPYLLRALAGTASRIGNYEFNKLVGGTYPFNQLVATYSSNSSTVIDNQDGALTATSNGTTYYFGIAVEAVGHAQLKTIIDHKYFFYSRIISSNIDNFRNFGVGNWQDGAQTSSQTSGEFAKIIRSKSDSVGTYFNVTTIGTSLNTDTFTCSKPILIDLTQMFGSTIADYIYNLETAQAGAGVSFFKSLFGADYYAYNAGELMSVKTSAHVTKDANNNVISNNALDPDLELRGIPKLDANNNLYYDGDTYESNGDVTRRYGIVDLGSLNYTRETFSSSSIQRWRFKASMPSDYKNPSDAATRKNLLSWKFTASNAPVNADIDEDNTITGYQNTNTIYIRCDTYTDPAAFKTAMSGVYLLYELATPTTESADPFTDPQEIDAQGSEEFIDARAVSIPVGHESYYANICEIDGIDEINLFHTGVNIWSEEWEVGSFSVTTGQKSSNPNIMRCKNPISVRPNTSYYLKAPKTAEFLYYDKDMNYLGYNSGIDANHITVIPDNTYFINFRMAAAYGNTYNNDISINYPATDTEYHAHTANESALVEIGQEVYGGYYDKDLGIVLTKKNVDLGSLTWNRTTSYSNPVFYANINDKKLGNNAFINTLFGFAGNFNNAQAFSVSDNGTLGNGTANEQIYARLDEITDKDTFKSFVTGVMLCYELADPIIIPADAVNFETVKGVNNVWSDTNGETEVKFYVKEA